MRSIHDSTSINYDAQKEKQLLYFFVPFAPRCRPHAAAVFHCWENSLFEGEAASPASQHQDRWLPACSISQREAELADIPVGLERSCKVPLVLTPKWPIRVAVRAEELHVPRRRRKIPKRHSRVVLQDHITVPQDVISNGVAHPPVGEKRRRFQ